MIENELETRRVNVYQIDVNRIIELERWFKQEYVERLNKLNRYSYLGLPLPESRYALEVEAYNKENELRELKGLEKLPEIKVKNIF